MSKIKVELQAIFGTDRTISEAAWTSSTTLEGKEKKTDEQANNLVINLAEEGHGVPFEHVIFRFWIRGPIQLDRQIITYRMASQSGMSGRYRTMPDDWLDIPEDVSAIYNKITPLETEVLKKEYNDLCRKANDYYRTELYALKAAEQDGFISNKDYKRAREFLRGVLPQNNMTERVITINLRSFANFLKQRLSEHAQPEIRHVAQEMLRLVKESNTCSTAINWLEKNNWKI